MSTNHVTQEAERLYLFDAMFHAQVEMAVQALDADLEAKTGSRLTYDDRSLATLAAACAVLVTRGPLPT